VQQNQGKRFDFERIKKHYEDVIPLRGKRREQNIRPINRRDRAYERMIKVSDTEYYITYDAYTHRTNHNKAITWSLNDGMEYMTIHTPRKIWGQTPSMELHPRSFSSASTFWFYDFNLPTEFNMVNHRANKYVRYDNKYYSVELGDVVFQRKVGENHWLPLMVHREFKHTIDRTQTKELRESIKPFMAYFDLMCEIVESKWEWSNPIYQAVAGEANDIKVKPEQAIALFKQKDDGSVPDEWLVLVERYKHRITRHRFSQQNTEYNRHLLAKEICDDLFCIVKPCNTTEVPIGTLSNDRYKGWYR
jgi:hypothetical protein